MLELDGLTRRYGTTVALDALTFAVPAGEVFGFLGPNGAGKTTAMRAVLGITALDAGEVRWKGAPVTAEDRLRFGYMPEERGLYPAMAVGDQLRYLAALHGLPPERARDATDHWLGRLGLAERAGERLEKLSLGNQQRAQLAAALVHDPELLVLDEPFSGLDPVGVDALAEVLAEQAGGGATVVFSSHQLDLVEHLCRSVAIIDRGRLVAEGTVDGLTATSARLVVGVDGDPDGAWARSLAGPRVDGTAAGRVRLALEPGADPQAVLRAALAAGPVTHFSTERRRLSEVFRDAVGKAA